MSAKADLYDSKSSNIALESAFSKDPLPLSPKSNCNGTTFADGEFWINNNQVKSIMEGDNYDTKNPSQNTSVDAVGIYSEKGTLDGDDLVHSVRVTGSDPTIVKSKGGITRSREVSPQNAYKDYKVLNYYGKKAGK